MKETSDGRGGTVAFGSSQWRLWISRRAFTLLESIVVISIITILAVVLMPLAQSLIQRSWGARCISNLRGIGSAVHLYAAENNMNLPPGNADGQEWFSVSSSKSWLAEYGAQGSEITARRLLRCPGDRTKAPITDFKNYYSYSFNAEQLLSYVNGAPAHGRAPVKLANAQRKVLFTDGASNAEDPSKVKKYPNSLSVDTAPERISRRHNDGANSLFGDGSVVWLSPSDATLSDMLRRD